MKIYSNDGKEFKDVESCLKYEKELNKNSEIAKKIKKVREELKQIDDAIAGYQKARLEKVNEINKLTENQNKRLEPIYYNFEDLLKDILNGGGEQI